MTIQNKLVLVCLRGSFGFQGEASGRLLCVFDIYVFMDRKVYGRYSKLFMLAWFGILSCVRFKILEIAL